MVNTQTPSPHPFLQRVRPHGLYRFVPILETLRTYQLSWFGHDILAGLVITAFLVPVGMAYAEAAGLPAIYGLYATIVPLLVYAIFGPGRILFLGPDSALAAVIAATILPLAAGNADKAVAFAGILAIISGLLCIAAGLTKFGFITDLLSQPIRYGYLNGIALTVLIGQLPKFFGFSVSGSSFIQEANSLLQSIIYGKINWTSFSLGLFSVIVILGLKRRAPRLPGALIVMTAATIIVWLFNLSAAADISVVGTVPQGLPSFRISTFTLAEFSTLLAGAFAVALVSFADMSVLSRTFALRDGYENDTNHEIIALGAANVATGLFQGFPISSSASRTTVAEAIGARTQITGIVGAVCIAFLLIFMPGLLQNMPASVLAAVVICACILLFEVHGVMRLYKLRRDEFALSLVCFCGVVLLGVITGIFIAVGLALLAFIWRAWRPYYTVLGHVDGLQSYHDISRHPEAQQIPGLLLFRWDAPLFFANAQTFREQILLAVAKAPTQIKWVVVAAEPVTDIDTTAADVLIDIDKTLHQAGMDLFFAEMKGPVKDRLKQYGLMAKLGTDNFFPTIEQAVERYQTIHRTNVTK